MITIVTGHSRGLGAAIAGELLDRGVAVLGISRKPNPELSRRHANRLREAALDLSDTATLRAWLASGELSRFLAGAERALLVNNAGLLQPIGPLPTQDLAAVAAAATVNVTAALVLSAAFVQETNGAADRRILHVSSGAGRKPYAGWSVYCATKAALDHHARCVAMDHTPRLRIASIAPGVIETDMQREIRESTPDLFPEHARFVAMKREGQLPAASDVARDLVDLALSERFGEEVVTERRR